MIFADLDANGWAVIIGAIGIIITNVVTQILSYLQRRAVAREVKVVKETLKASDKRTNEQLTTVAEQLNENTETTNAIATATGELHQQGNSRWDEIKGELKTANAKIDALQQLRVDEARNKEG